MKQVLDITQMQHLQELGLDTSNASMLHCELYDAAPILVESKHKFYKEENAIILDGVRSSVIYCKKVTYVYTLQDVLDALPRFVIDEDGNKYYLQIEMMNTEFDDWRVSYKSADYDESPLGYFQAFHLIDAAVRMLVLCFEQGYVKTNKEDKK